MPRRSRSLWFDVDTNLYRPFTREGDRRFKGAWLALSGLNRAHRICIPLAGAGLDQFAPRTDKRHSSPGLRIEVTDRRIVFHSVERIDARKPTGQAEAGLDKGYRTLFTVTTGEPENAMSYGTRAKLTIDRLAEAAVERQRHRRRLVAYERSLRNSSSSAARQKARRIRRSNLGRARARRAVQRERGILRDQINSALNEMFADQLNLARLHVEYLGFRGKRLSTRANRSIGRWLKGFLQQRLHYKAELNGVELNVVNAAYTSQTCPWCGYVSRRNRIGERFECGHCGNTGSADAVAATNVLRRGRDLAISRFMSKEDVKQILEARWRSALLEAPGAQTATVNPSAGAANDARSHAGVIHACGSHLLDIR
jgi:IS605 OrfB family transposase